MTSNQPEDQLLFLHIPKTAGTSLNQMLSKAYGVMNPTTGKFIHYNTTLSLVRDSKRRKRPVILGHVYYDVTQILAKSQKIITFLRDPVKRTISAYEFMKSHPEVWLGKIAQGSITEFLEHPTVNHSIRNVQTRLLGVKFDLKKLYADRASGRITEAEYHQRILDFGNTQVDENDLSTAIARLKTLDFVGFTHTFDKDVEELFELLDKPFESVAQANRTPSHFRKRDKYTEEELNLVKSLNALDIKLFENALKIRNRPAMEI